MRRKRNSWGNYITTNGVGYYIKRPQNRLTYGPFKTPEIAEFFNFIAFVSPRSPDAEREAKDGIVFKDYAENPAHPNRMFENSLSPFKVWWQDTWGIPLTTHTIMGLANECGAGGYRSFSNWLILNGKINGRAPHQQIS